MLGFIDIFQKAGEGVSESIATCANTTSLFFAQCKFAISFSLVRVRHFTLSYSGGVKSKIIADKLKERITTTDYKQELRQFCLQQVPLLCT